MVNVKLVHIRSSIKVTCDFLLIKLTMISIALMRVNIFISGGFLIATLIRIVLCVSILDLFPDYIILPIIGLIHLILINIGVPMNNSRLLHDLCAIGELVCHIFSFLSTESSDALEKSFSFLRVRQNARLLTTL